MPGLASLHPLVQLQHHAHQLAQQQIVVVVLRPLEAQHATSQAAAVPQELQLASAKAQVFVHENVQGAGDEDVAFLRFGRRVRLRRLIPTAALILLLSGTEGLPVPRAVRPHELRHAAALSAREAQALHERLGAARGSLSQLGLGGRPELLENDVDPLLPQLLQLPPGPMASEAALQPHQGSESSPVQNL
eukprot:scaffold13_cov241-Pinguiococcus_pyrenoidosus.AAC.28